MTNETTTTTAGAPAPAPAPAPDSTLIRPGLLVSLSTAITGGVVYEKTIIEADHIEAGARVARWETVRQIADAEEHERAQVARSRCRTMIVAQCRSSGRFGYLCPIENEAKLRAAFVEARAIAAAHNLKAQNHFVEVYMMTGRIAASDAEAAQAIGAVVRGLLAAMEAGVRAADPERIREAAAKARALAGMLSTDTQRKVSAAVEEVRKVAREIVRRVGKSGEQAAAVVDGLKLDALAAARFAVLDLTPADDAASEPVAGEGVVAGRALDLLPADMVPPPPPAPPVVPEFELEVDAPVAVASAPAVVRNPFLDL